MVKNLWVIKIHILEHNSRLYKRSFASYNYLYCCLFPKYFCWLYCDCCL